MSTRFTKLDALVPFAKARSRRGLYDGRMTLETRRLIEICRHIWAFNPVECAVILFTRDVGHNSSGWWKNPDYERCWHLSLSYADQRTGAALEHDKDRSQVVARAFFGDDVRLAWLEPPYSPEGKVRQVWHYRVFADEGWQPLKPRGEVYSRDWTPRDWKSFSEIHGFTPEPDPPPPPSRPHAP